MYLGVNPKKDPSAKDVQKEKKLLNTESNKKKNKFKNLQSTYQLNRTSSKIETLVDTLIKDSNNGRDQF